MFFVSPEKRLQNEIEDALRKHFQNEKVEIQCKQGALYITIHEGFPEIEHRLTQEQLDNGTIGGGLISNLNGKTFKLVLEIKQ